MFIYSVETDVQAAGKVQVGQGEKHANFDGSQKPRDPSLWEFLEHYEAC